MKGDAAGAVAGGVEDVEGVAGEGEGLAVVEGVGGVGCDDGSSREGGEVEGGVGEEIVLGGVEVDGEVGVAGADVVEAADVVEVGVGEQDAAGGDAQGGEAVEEGVGFKACVDDPGVGRVVCVAGGVDEVAVGGPVAEGEGFDLDGGGHGRSLEGGGLS